MSDTPGPSRFAVLRRITRRLGTHRAALAFIVAALVFDAAFNAAIPIAFKVLLDDAIAGRDHRLLVSVLAFLAAGVLVYSTTAVYRDYLHARLCAAVVNDLRREMFEHLQRLSMGFYGRVEAGDLLTRFSSDMVAVENAMVGALVSTILPALDLAFSGALLFTLDWRLALVAMLVLPLSLVGPSFVAPKASRAGHARKESESTVLSAISEDLAGHAVVKAFGIEGARAARLVRRLGELTLRSARVGFLGALIERSAGVSALAVHIAVLGIGAILAFSESITIGTLVSFVSLFLTFSAALATIMRYAPTLVQAAASLERIHEILGEKPEVVDAPGAVDLPRLSREIVFAGVGFRYAPDRRDLDDIALTIRAGQSVAFVGASGSGKSTVLKLLARFYDPAEGRIIVDGRHLLDCTEASWRRQLGVVFQESYLFNTTVLENLRIGKPDATEEEIVAATRAAGVHDAIATLPQGYETVVGEGGRRLSGGQRQRIAIARALLRDPAVLLLDEATSALDPATEAAINATLEVISRGRTLVSVTHRLAAVAGFDTVCVFDQGRLVEQGNPTELVEAGGAYAQLWSKQSGFAIAEDGTAEVGVDRLKAIPLLAELGDELLAELSKRLATERFAPGETIIEEDDLSDRFYLIAHGSVRVTTLDASGSERELAVLQDGDYFGEVEVLRDIRRTSTVRARVACVMLVLRRDQFQHLLARVPHVHARIDRQIDERIGELVRAKALL